MVFGQNLARCHKCGAAWIVGDAIPAYCPECEEKIATEEYIHSLERVVEVATGVVTESEKHPYGYLIAYVHMAVLAKTINAVVDRRRGV